MFCQPVIILSKPIISAKILNTCPASVESGHRLNECGDELISHTHLNPDSDEKIALNHDLKTQKADLSYICQVLNHIAEKLKKCCENIFTKHKEEIARLSVEISRKILVQKIEDGDYKIETIVKEVLKNVPMHQDIEVHLNPKDLELCQQAFQDEQDYKLTGIKLISDPGIGRAECLVKSPKGIVQSFIDEHLEQISEALQKA
jgi:flagellar biosynthesis/type III secretory pathway protein FliH